MANSKLTMELSDSGEAVEANEFPLESYTFGSDEVFPEETRNPAIGEKIFMIGMSAKLTEFHHLSSSSMLGTTFPKVWVRSYASEGDETKTKTAEFAFENARPIAFELKSNPAGLFGFVTFAYSKAERN